MRGVCKRQYLLALLCKIRWVISQVDCSMLISVMLRLTSLPDSLFLSNYLASFSTLMVAVIYFCIYEQPFHIKMGQRKELLSITFEYNVTALVSACKCECICSWHDRNPIWSISLLIHPMMYW